MCKFQKRITETELQDIRHRQNMSVEEGEPRKDSYQKMVVIFVDLLGKKNNTQFEDKFLIHKLFHGEARTNEARNLKHVIYDRKVLVFLIVHIFSITTKKELKKLERMICNL